MKSEDNKSKSDSEHHKHVVSILSDISTKVSATLDLDKIISSTFELLDTYFNYKHIMILLVDPKKTDQLKVIASHGYNGEGIGAIVPFGKGVIGTVAKNKKLLRMGNLQAGIRYMNSLSTDKQKEVIDLPGIENCKSQMAVPLLVQDELIGVFSVESLVLATFNKKDQELLELIGVQIGIAVNNAKQFDLIEDANAKLKDLNENLELKVTDRTKELADQKAIVEAKNEEILDSIRYAVRIQKGILPSSQALSKSFTDHFILYKPKDLVSGDFYWLNKQENKVYFSVIDCTGHGVPGAFVSIVGAVGLRRAIIEKGIDMPSDALESLNDFIEMAINSKGNVKDGMDIALCAIDFDNLELEFSGAHNGALIYRDNEFIELKADRQPVGSFDYKTPYTNHKVNLQKGDRIYLTTDGFIDQFGGTKGKKFMKRRYKKLLIENQHLNLSEQGVLLDNTLQEWMGDHPQVDDICVLGIEI